MALLRCPALRCCIAPVGLEGSQPARSNHVPDPCCPLPPHVLPHTLSCLLPPTTTTLPLPCSYRNEFEEASKYNEQLAANLGKVVDDLHPVRVLQLFSAIPHEVGLLEVLWVLGALGAHWALPFSTQDCELVDLNSRLKDLLMTHASIAGLTPCSFPLFLLLPTTAS